MSAKFSIVLPTLNRRPMLLEALASIQAQHYPRVEIIVVDGGSTDGTLELLRERPDIVLVRDADRGVYDGFNQGLAAATGDIVGFLNSDDVYEPGAFAAVGRAFTENPDADAACGTALLEADDRLLAVFDAEADKTLTEPRTIFIGNCIINARFFRRPALAQIGGFDLEYRYVSDRDWLARCYSRSIRTVAVPGLVYRYRSHAGSLTFSANPDRKLGIREDLLRLARNWRDRPSLPSGIEPVLRLLEGRCLATLIAAALRRRDFGKALRLIFQDRHGYSHRPLAAIVLGGFDVIIQRIRGVVPHGAHAR